MIKTIINHPLGMVYTNLYHLFLVIWGMVYGIVLTTLHKYHLRNPHHQAKWEYAPRCHQRWLASGTYRVWLIGISGDTGHIWMDPLPKWWFNQPTNQHWWFTLHNWWYTGGILGYDRNSYMNYLATSDHWNHGECRGNYPKMAALVFVTGCCGV